MSPLRHLALGVLALVLLATRLPAQTPTPLSSDDSALVVRLQAQLVAAQEAQDAPEILRLGVRVAHLLRRGDLLHRAGHIYESGGPGIPADDAEAVRVFQLAADLGEPESQHHIGMRHLEGRGVPLSRFSAIRLLESSARKYHRPADSVLTAIARREAAARQCAGEALKRLGYVELGGDIQGSMAGRDRFIRILSGAGYDGVRGDIVTLQGPASWSRYQEFEMRDIRGFVGITERPIGDAGLVSREPKTITAPSTAGIRELERVNASCAPAP